MIVSAETIVGSQVYGEEGVLRLGQVENISRPNTYSSTEDAVRGYLKEIGDVDLLTKNKEIELAKKIKKGDAGARGQLILATYV